MRWVDTRLLACDELLVRTVDIFLKVNIPVVEAFLQVAKCLDTGIDMTTGCIETQACLTEITSLSYTPCILPNAKVAPTHHGAAASPYCQECLGVKFVPWVEVLQPGVLHHLHHATASNIALVWRYCVLLTLARGVRKCSCKVRQWA